MRNSWLYSSRTTSKARYIIIKLEYGKEIDLWAYGVLVFELLSGYNPFYDPNPKIMYENVMNVKINWPPYINRLAECFIKRLLVFDPEMRLKTEMFRHHILFSVRKI